VDRFKEEPGALEDELDLPVACKCDALGVGGSGCLWTGSGPTCGARAHELSDAVC
jgi:hypothetical protein